MAAPTVPAEAAETTEAVPSTPNSRNRWNLDPSLSEADKRKARRKLRAELAKAKASGVYSDELNAALQPIVASGPTEEEDEEAAEEEGDDEEAELRRRRRLERKIARQARTAATRSTLTAAAVAMPARPTAEELVTELRQTLDEVPELNMGYMFTLSDVPSAQILLDKFTSRWGCQPTVFRLDKANTVLLGHVPQ